MVLWPRSPKTSVDSSDSLKLLSCDGQVVYQKTFDI